MYSAAPLTSSGPSLPHTRLAAACDRPGVSEKLPACHGSSADAPRGQKLPPPQTKHAVAPLASEGGVPLSGGVPLVRSPRASPSKGSTPSK